MAETAAIAEDALEAIDVSLEPLQPVASAQAATAIDAPRLHADAVGNVCAEFSLQLGDVEKAFRQADGGVGVI